MAYSLQKFKVVATFTEDMLGTAPSNPNVYSEFIAGKKYKEQLKAAKTDEAKAEVAEQTADLAAEEVALLPPETLERPTVFRRNDKGELILMDYMIRGFLKEAGQAISGVWGIGGKIDRWVFVGPRQIPITRKGKPLTQADSDLQRSLRAQTPMGMRSTLTASEAVAPGAQITFIITLLPLGQDPKKGNINEATLREWLDYGALCGLGQWRSGSFGRFTYEISPAK